MPTVIASEFSVKKQGSLKNDLHQAIRLELDEMLGAPIFAQSARCKNFLSFIVSETLAGNAPQLKERIIGINVFKRANDYDTGDDSIVRVTANEVRKRIGQFYLETSKRHSVHIELPRGSYVPEFRLNPTTPGIDETASPDNPETSIHSEQVPHDASSPPHEEHGSTSHMHPASDQPSTVTEGPSFYAGQKSSIRRGVSRLTWGAVVLVILGLVCAVGVWHMRSLQKPPSVWAAFRNSEVPVLICLGAHDLPPTNWTMSTSDADRFPNLILRKQVIPIDDASVIANLGSLLGVQRVPFRVTSADPSSLSDLRRQPVILVGALDNKWSLLISNGLPYRLERVYTQGGNGIWTGSIIDSKNPSRRWNVDFSIPMSNWQHDYAIVARFDDSLTGVPVMLEGGLGNNGSLAASEFLSSHDLDRSLANEPTCSGRKSFEAIIETEIIDAKPGPPHALRIVCW